MPFPIVVDVLNASNSDEILATLSLDAEDFESAAHMVGYVQNRALSMATKNIRVTYKAKMVLDETNNLCAGLDWLEHGFYMHRYASTSAPLGNIIEAGDIVSVTDEIGKILNPAARVLGFSDKGVHLLDFTPWKPVPYECCSLNIMMTALAGHLKKLGCSWLSYIDRIISMFERHLMSGLMPRFEESLSLASTYKKLIHEHLMTNIVSKRNSDTVIALSTLDCIVCHPESYNLGTQSVQSVNLPWLSKEEKIHTCLTLLLEKDLLV